MILWIVFAVMAAIVAGAILYALRPGDPVESPGESGPDVAVYQDQLAAIDGELDSGLLDKDDAETARIEISRRLLAAAKVEAPKDSRSGGGLRLLAIASALAAVVAGLGGYLLTGSPDLADQPFSARTDLQPERQNMATLISRMEEHLEAYPDDGRGWDLLAPIYLRLGRPTDAARAFNQVIRIEGETGPRLTGLAEALVRANNGDVTGDARSALARAVELDPDALRPKFFLIVAQEQDGELEGALQSWRALLQEAPQDAPWRDAVESRVKMIEARVRAASSDAPDVAPSGRPSSTQGANSGPSDQGVGDAAARAAEERRLMIDGMVARLAGRLAENGDDLEGWLRLIRSYAVLGHVEKAKSSLETARRQFTGDTASLDKLAALALEVGLQE